MTTPYETTPWQYQGGVLKRTLRFRTRRGLASFLARQAAAQFAQQQQREANAFRAGAIAGRAWGQQEARSNAE